MRIINKKYLLIILLIGIILTSVIVFKPTKENIQLDNVILKQEINNKTFAMYKEDGENNYVPVEGTKFPDMYVLNITKSKCIDNNGKEVDNILNFNNGEVTVTSGKTTYCYLYFDKSLGLEIKDENPNGLNICEYDAETKYEQCGGMHRFQGQQNDNIENYICFGTSDKDTCTKDTDHYMYRIIGIEAETGRVKVIKKEALNERISWWDNYDDDIEFPDSNIYKAIKGTDFLENPTYVPEGWEEKISNNTWLYGDMISYNTLGARQTGLELYKTETGQKGTIWDEKANQGDEGAQSAEIITSESSHKGETIYYIKHANEKWNKTFPGKVSLMYLHDYYLSVSNIANCQLDENNYEICQTGWMHLSQNDIELQNVQEWTMSRAGWDIGYGWFNAHIVHSTGYTGQWSIVGSYSVRPVFYINASEELLSENETGTLEDPFMIK